MYIKVGKEFADGDFNFLKRYLEILDKELHQIIISIKNSSDPDSDGLCDYGEYIIGQGFLAIQTYLNKTYPYTDLKKGYSLNLRPYFKSVSYANIINAGANYFKHQDEWDIWAVINKDRNALGDQAKRTVEIIEAITPWSDYTLSNLLAELLDNPLDLIEIKISKILPYVTEWRNNVALKA